MSEQEQEQGGDESNAPDYDAPQDEIQAQKAQAHEDDKERLAAESE